MKNTKKSKKQKVKLIESDFRQALDYCYVMSNAYCVMIEKCDALKIPEINLAYQKLTDNLFDFYQLIGKHWNEYYPGKEHD